MKWFEKLFKEEENQNESIGSFVTLNKITEEIEETKKLVEEHKEKVEEVKPPKEMIDIEVKGNCKLEIVEREERYSFQFPLYARFNYDVTVNFLGEKLKLKSYFNLSPSLEHGRYYGEEKMYVWLAEMLGSDVIMEELKRNIENDIKRYVRDKNIAKLKETIEKNKSFNIDFTLQVEKTSAFEIK